MIDVEDLEPVGPDSEEDHIRKCFDFNQLGLDERILRAIREAGFTECTPIQARALPYSVEGQDIVGKAQTGTGKTAAFLLTIFQSLCQSKPSSHSGKKGPATPQAVILAPTRELALQITQDGKILGKHLPFTVTPIFGGMEYEKQRKELAGNPEIIVATPGRLIDYLKQREISFREVRFSVIDEADRMFDMGFYPDIKYLMRKMPPFDKRQTLLFSATMSYRVTELSYEFMNNPIEVDVSVDQITINDVEEELYHVALDEKLPLFLGILKKEKANRVIVFCNTKSGVEWLTFKLKGNGFEVQGLTGDVSQKRRLSIVRAFKEGQLEVVVATDVASRGLHVDEISHVFNYDVPEDPENYVHRIGRTARAGQSGKAITLACENYVLSLPEIENFVTRRIPVMSYEMSDLIPDQAGRYVRKPRERFGGKPGPRRSGGRNRGGRGHSQGRSGGSQSRSRRKPQRSPKGGHKKGR